jgi:hypothetical protein
MKRHLPFIIVTVLCLPFCVFIAIYLLAFISPSIPDVIGIPLLTGLYWLSRWPVIALLVLLPPTGSVVLVWFQSVKTRVEIIATGIYSVVIVLHICAALWCVVTRPVFDL